MKTKGLLTKYTFRWVFTALSYFFVLRMDTEITNTIFPNIFLYIFPIFYDMMYVSENCTNQIKIFYKTATAYSLFYLILSSFGLFGIIAIKENKIIFLNSLLSKLNISFPASWIMIALSLSVIFIIIDGSISKREEAETL